MQKLKTCILYFPIWLFKKSKMLTAVSCRLVQLTGKSKYPIHPKHLIDIPRDWLLKNIKTNDFVLDIGCGNGQHSIKIASRCRKIIGIDVNIKQLSIAKAAAKDQGKDNITFLYGNLEQKLKIKSNFFDKVICLDVLEHLTHRVQLLHEIKRILKPTGIIFLTVPNSDTSWKKLQKKCGLNYFSDPDHKIEYSLTEIKKELTKLGLKILSIKPIVFDTPWVGFIDIIGGISLDLYKKISIWKQNKVKTNLKDSTGFRIKASIKNKF